MKSPFLIKKQTIITCVSFLSAIAVMISLPALPVRATVTQTAVVAMAASDYSSGAHATVSVEPLGGPRSLQENLAPSGSDLTVVAYGKYFYRMERSGANNITKFDINSPANAVWQYSTEGSETGSNPHDLAFLSETKAYLFRYGSPTLWVVNPSATDEADFKINEIDLSAYADGDLKPEMHSGVIVNGLLFIVIQRIDFSGGWGNYVYHTPWIAVFDTRDDSEVDTGKGDGTRLGIPLPIKNPSAIQYVAASHTVYVQGTSQYTAAESGIAAINPTTYDASLILDANNYSFGAVSGMAIVSSNKGYFVAYAGWGDNTLYTFNPEQVNPSVAAVSGLENIGIGGMETGTYLDRNGMLWLCTSTFTSASIVVLDTSTDLVDETIDTSLVPLRVAFAQEGTEVETNDDDDDDSGCFIGGLIRQQEK